MLAQCTPCSLESSINKEDDEDSMNSPPDADANLHLRSLRLAGYKTLLSPILPAELELLSSTLCIFLNSWDSI